MQSFYAAVINMLIHRCVCHDSYIGVHVIIHGDDMSTMCPIGLLMFIIVCLIYVTDVSTTLTIYHDV
jgi:hypothetical protein